MGGSAKTYEEKHPIGVPFPSVCHHTVLFLSPVEIHREESLRTIGEVGLSGGGLVLLGNVTVIYKSEDEKAVVDERQVHTVTLVRINYRFGIKIGLWVRHRTRERSREEYNKP